MISSGDTVICGLSGGADSVCLLLMLIEISRELHFTVEALHVNHCLRGTESDRDENFCRELCKNLNVKFSSVRVDVKSYAEKYSLSTEESARKLRYSAFQEYSEGKKIATAHNADDNLETVILNLSRGSALKGLAGIPPVRNNIVRPLLPVTRKEIEIFLKSKGQSFVTDSTNLSDNYTRNKIRHKIIPLLKEINSSAVETSINSISALRSENSLIESETRKALNLCRDGNSLTGLADFHEVVRKRCISVLLSENNLPYSSERLESADRIAVNGGKISVSRDLYLVSDGKCIQLKKIDRKSPPQIVSAKLKIGENTIFSDKKMICRLLLCDNLKKLNSVHNLLTFSVMDYDKILGEAIVRNRKYGDKIQLCGRSFTSSLRKLINENIPADMRETLMFIEDSKGVIFAENFGIAQRVAPDSSTRRFLAVEIKNIN